METSWECIVVGGGAAGLSAALVLGRARRRTLLIDAGRQSNLASAGIGGLLGHDGRPPAQLYAMGRDELAAYPTAEVRAGEVVDGRRQGDGFELVLADGSHERARRVLLATGMEYRHPTLPGVAERWGHSVFHCPFCHGWEHRDQPLGVLDDGATGAQRALLLRAWSDDVTLYAAAVEDEDRIRLERAGVTVDERAILTLEGPAPSLTAVVLDGGTRRSCGGLLVPTVLHQRSPLAARLGATLVGKAPVVADAIEVDASGHAAPGLSAAGDAAPSMPSAVNAMAAGAGAAAMLVHDIVMENADAAPVGP